jgi:hypothetical protein
MPLLMTGLAMGSREQPAKQSAPRTHRSGKKQMDTYGCISEGGTMTKIRAIG